jgi:hypothetical protein
MGNAGSDQSESWVVYEKTIAGAEEIQTRKHNLPQTLRTLLIVVDGKKTAGAILNQFSLLKGAAPALAALEEKGLIARRTDVLAPGTVSPEEALRRAGLARTFMMNTVTDAVGSMGLSLIETLRKCETLPQLQAHFDDYLYAITSGRGKATAEEYRAELANLLPSRTS